MAKKTMVHQENPEHPDLSKCKGCPFLRPLYCTSVRGTKGATYKYCAHIIIAGTPRPKACSIPELKKEFNALDEKTKHTWAFKQ